MPDERVGTPIPATATSPGLRVLLAEDSVINQKVAIRQLESLGCSVDAVGTGMGAIAALNTARYDLVLMDCQMPVMDGYAAARMIRHIEGSSRRTPIVAMTASTDEVDRGRCLAAGMDDYVTKPLRAEDLAAVLGKWASAPR